MRNSEPQEIGEVTDILPSAQYRVRLPGPPRERTIRCYLSGRMRVSKVRVVRGNRVSVVVSGEIGRITRRL